MDSLPGAPSTGLREGFSECRMSAVEEKLRSEQFLRELLSRCGFSGEILEDVAEVCELHKISVESLANDRLSVCEIGTKLLLTDDEVEAVVRLAKAEVAGMKGVEVVEEQEQEEEEGGDKENVGEQEGKREQGEGKYLWRTVGGWKGNIVGVVTTMGRDRSV